MIVDLLIIMIFVVVNAFMTPLLALAAISPNVPAGLVTLVDTITSYVHVGAGTVKTILGTTLVNTTFTLITAGIALILGWRITVFIYRVIRG